jgi:uncharacterized membrane protein YgcG
VPAAPPQELLDLAEADPEGETLFTGWEKLRTSGVPGVDLAVHKALTVLVGWAGVAEPLARLGGHLGSRTVKTCLRSVYRGLSARSHSQVKVTLGLCTAIVSLGPASTREFCLAFDFTLKSLGAMGAGRTTHGSSSSKAKCKLPPDRPGFVAFMLTLLEHGDEAVVQKVSVTHPLLGTLFVGMENDPPRLQTAVLEAVRDRVVRASVMRKNKLGVLNSKALLQVARLYRSDALVPAEEMREPPMTVRALAHQVLLEACCSPEFGICFAVKQHQQHHHAGMVAVGGGGCSLPTPTAAEVKPNNPVLLHFVAGLVDAPDDPLLRELVLRIVATCPDILPQYFKMIRLPMEPRLSLEWMCCSSFVARILAQHPCSVFTMGLMAEPSHRLDATVPIVATGAALSHGLQAASPLVAQFSAQLLVVVLERLQRTLDQLELVSSGGKGSGGGEGGGGADAAALATYLLEGARKRLPDVQILLTLRHRAFQGTMQGTELLQCAVLKVVERYQQLFPEALAAARFDFAKLLPSTEQLEAASKRVQLAVVSALSVCAGSVKWWLHAKGSPRSHIGSLLRLYVAADEHDVSAATLTVLESLLHATELFDGQMDEVRLWMEAVKQYPAAAPFIERVLCQLVQDPYPHMDAVTAATAELQQLNSPATDGTARAAAAAAAAAGGGGGGGSGGGGGGGGGRGGGSEGEGRATPPYSPLIPAMLEQLACAAAAAEDGAEADQPFDGANGAKLASTVAMVTTALSAVIRSQTSPDALLVTVTRHAAALPALASTLHLYASSWLVLSDPAVQNLVPEKHRLPSSPPYPEQQKKKLKLKHGGTNNTESAGGNGSWSDRGGGAAVAVLPLRAWRLVDAEMVATGSMFDGAGPDQQEQEAPSFTELLDHCNRAEHLVAPGVVVQLEKALQRLPSSRLPAGCLQLLGCVRGLVVSVRVDAHATGGGDTGQWGCHSTQYHAITTCFVLVRQAMQLAWHNQPDDATLQALLDVVLRHPVVDREFCRRCGRVNSQSVGWLEALLDFHVVHLINDGSCRTATKLPVVEALLARLVAAVAAPTRLLSGTKQQGGADDGVGGQHTFAVAKAAVRWFTPTDARSLVQALLGLPNEVLVAPKRSRRQSAASGGGTTKLTDVGELLMALLGSEDAAVASNVTAASFQKLLALSQELVCPAVDAAVATLLAVNLDGVDGIDDAKMSASVVVVVGDAWDATEFAAVADARYVQFCCQAPTPVRDLIMARLIATNPQLLQPFEALQLELAPTERVELPNAVKAYVQAASEPRESTDPWQLLCLPLQALPTALTATSKAALSALLVNSIQQCGFVGSDAVGGVVGGTRSHVGSAASPPPLLKKRCSWCRSCCVALVGGWSSSCRGSCWTVCWLLPLARWR